MTPREIRAFYKSLTNEKAKPSYKEKEKAAEKANNDIKDPDIESTGIKKKQYGSRSKSGKLSGTYRQHYHRALSAIMSFALKSGYITVNPMQAVDAPRKDTPEAEFLEAADVAALVDALEDLDEPMWQAFFMLALYSSCRPGELIGLNWSDFNLDENELLIKAGSTYVKGKGTVRTDRPKTKSSVRKIILPEEALAPVKHWKSVQSEYRLKFNGKWPGEDAVFTGDLGKRIDKSSPTQKWRKIQERYGLKDVPLYSLRHTGASLMVAYGATIKEVSGRLGHSRTSTTLDIYTHLFTVAENHTSDIMSDAIKAAREGAKRGRFTQLGG